MGNIQKIKPSGIFTNYIFKSIPLAFDESLSYYETLSGILDLLKTQEEVINNNADLLSELESYVKNYFDNLDVQEEINNKLDEMAQDGTLENLIGQYIQLSTTYIYNNVSEMKQATNLVNGSYVKTSGFYSYNDNGGANYKVREIVNTDIVDEKKLIALNNENLVAEILCNDTIKPEQFGAYGDGTHDDTQILQYTFNYAYDNNVIVKLYNTYLITSQINASGYIDGEKKGLLKTDPTTRFEGGILNASYLIVKNLNFDCSSNVEFTLNDKFTRYNNAIRCLNGTLYVDNCEFHNLYNVFIDCHGNNNNVIITNSRFYQDNKTNVYLSSHIILSLINNEDAVLNICNNSIYGYEYDYIGTYDNDSNINAGGIVCDNINVNELLINNNLLDNLGKYGSIAGNLGFSRLCVIDLYYNVHNAKITNNKLCNCHWTPIRMHGSNNSIIQNNLITLSRDCTECIILLSDGLSSNGESPVGLNNLSISNNIFKTVNGVFEQGIFINGYSNISPNPIGFYGNVDNIVIENNLFDVNCKNYIFFDPTLKECIINNNIFKGAIENTNMIFLKAYDYDVLDTATYGVDFSNTKLDIYNNKVEINGVSIYNTSSSDTRKVLYNQIVMNIYKNIFRNNYVGYVLYGTGNDKMTAIDNIMWGVGGIFSMNKAYKNLSFYKSNGIGFYNITNGADNTEYLIS